MVFKRKRTTLFQILFALVIAALEIIILQKSNNLRENRHQKEEISSKGHFIVPFNNINNNYKLTHSKMGSYQPSYGFDIEKFRLVCAAILKWSNIVQEKDKDPILNRHQFSYSINSTVCSKFSPQVIIFVQTAVKNFEQRTLIRRTWAAVSMVKNITLRTVFMLGQTDERTVQQGIENESSAFGDIVQGDFRDTYRNLTYKHIMSLGWLVTQCPDVKLIVKVDDDTILNIYNLVDHLSKVNFKPNFLCCSIYHHQGPVRYLDDKWYVNTSTYPFEKYPDYCEGFGYLMSPDVARSLYKASENTRFYWVDDVYVTGILPLKVGLRLADFMEGHEYIRNSRSRVQVQDAMFIASKNNWDLYWNNVLQNASMPHSIK